MAQADTITIVATVAAVVPRVRAARWPPCRMRTSGEPATAWGTSLRHAHPAAVCAGDWPHTVPSATSVRIPLFEAELADFARRAGAVQLVSSREAALESARRERARAPGSVRP